MVGHAHTKREKNWKPLTLMSRKDLNLFEEDEPEVEILIERIKTELMNCANLKRQKKKELAWELALRFHVSMDYILFKCIL